MPHVAKTCRLNLIESSHDRITFIRPTSCNFLGRFDGHSAGNLLLRPDYIHTGNRRIQTSNTTQNFTVRMPEHIRNCHKMVTALAQASHFQRKSLTHTAMQAESESAKTMKQLGSICILWWLPIELDFHRKQALLKIWGCILSLSGCLSRHRFCPHIQRPPSSSIFHSTVPSSAF